MSIDTLKFKQVSDSFIEKFSKPASDLFISPGRVEIIGNHTDHQHGQTLSMSVDRYIYGAVRKREDFIVTSFNRGFPQALIVDLNDLKINEEEFGTSASLIRGVAAYFKEHGYQIGGFDAYSMSSIPRGMGMSSSAAFEVFIAQVFNHYFNNDKIDDLFIAKASQFAEQVYFNKPCGLLDQMTIAYGGVVYCDFNQSKPVKANLTSINKDLHFFVINTGKSHAKLTEHYALITEDLAKVSAVYEKKYLIDVDEDTFKQDYSNLLQTIGQRPLKRATHVFDENRRVVEAFECLSQSQNNRFLELIRASGVSSRDLLQNLTYPGDKDKMLLKCFDKIYRKTDFGVRVNGGGFAGTIIVMGRHADDEEVLKKLLAKDGVKILPVNLAKFKAGHVKKLS